MRTDTRTSRHCSHDAVKAAMGFSSLRRRLLARVRAGTSSHPPADARDFVVDPRRPNILLLGSLLPAVEEQLEDAFAVHRVRNDLDKERGLQDVGPAIRALAVANGEVIGGRLLERLPALEIVSSFGAGYEQIDVACCTASGVVVTHTPDVPTEETADTAIGLLLMTVRELSSAERWLREGKWSRQGSYPLTAGTLRNRTLGIAGLGRVGKAVARRAGAFGLPIAYCGRHRQPDVAYRYYADLVTMAHDVDTLVVCARGGPATRHMVNAEVLNALGPDGVVINVSRGSCVDEDALITALRTGKILAAGLDVYEGEPTPRRDLLSLERTVLLPHVGTASRDTRRAMGQLLADNLTSWFQSGTVLTPVAEQESWLASGRQPTR